MRVFITGATGFVGARLSRELLRRGHGVVALTRDRRRVQGAALADQPGERYRLVEGDPTVAGPWQEELAGCDAVVALAGEPIVGQRWSADFKARAEHSHVAGLERIAETVGRLPPERRPRALLSASAVGYYGPHGDAALDEDAAPGSGFLAQLCVRWEVAAQRSAEHGVRVVRLRIGIVLGAGGGVLGRMAPAFRAFVGGPIGSGAQYLSWVHVEDVVGIILFALESDASGPLNVTAPEPVTMEHFARALGQVLGRPSFLRVPGLALRLALGEGAAAILTGQRVLPRRVRQLGYRFRHEHLAEALAAIFSGSA